MDFDKYILSEAIVLGYALIDKSTMDYVIDVDRTEVIFNVFQPWNHFIAKNAKKIISLVNGVLPKSTF